MMRNAKPASKNADGIDLKHGQPIRRMPTPQAQFPENVWKMALKVARGACVRCKNRATHTHRWAFGMLFFTLSIKQQSFPKNAGRRSTPGEMPAFDQMGPDYCRVPHRIPCASPIFFNLVA